MGKLDQIRALGPSGIHARVAVVSRETHKQPKGNKASTIKIMRDVLERVLARKSDRIA